MKILKINNKNLKEVVDITSNFIKKGKIIVFPTDTVYGILCDATNKKAVNRIFKIKKRKPQKPLPIFVKNIQMAKKLAKINKEQEKFLKKAWPGKTTTILERKKTLKIYGVDKKTIAMRIPSSKPLNLLLKKINIPLAQTSANVSSKNPAKTAKEIIKIFKNKKQKPDFVIDVGKFKKSKPSTIIDLTVSPPKILRP